MTDPRELKPCPFCNAPAELDYSRYFRAITNGNLEKAVAVYCTQCSADMTLCRGDHSGYDEEQLADVLIEEWNRRFEQTLADKRPDWATVNATYEKWKSRAERAETQLAEMRKALAEKDAALVWYENNVAGCRLIHSGGDAHRNALAEDGGRRAKEAIARRALNAGGGE